MSSSLWLSTSCDGNVSTCSCETVACPVWCRAVRSGMMYLLPLCWERLSKVCTCVQKQACLVNPRAILLKWERCSLCGSACDPRRGSHHDVCILAQQATREITETWQNGTIGWRALLQVAAVLDRQSICEFSTSQVLPRWLARVSYTPHEQCQHTGSPDRAHQCLPCQLCR